MKDALLIRWPRKKSRSLRNEGISLFIEFFKILNLEIGDDTIGSIHASRRV